MCVFKNKRINIKSMAKKWKALVYTQGGHRRFNREDLLASLGSRLPNKAKKITLAYCRVYTSKQKDELERQITVVSNYCEKNGYSYRVIQDIGSGINYNRNGLQQLIVSVCSGECERIVVNYKDRLVRFGYEMLETMCKEHNVLIEIINQTNEVTSEQELVDDVLSIITVFSAKLYGQRSHKNKQIVEQNKALFTKDGDKHG
jgi:predicted site-specific integrase-resolvase